MNDAKCDSHHSDQKAVFKVSPAKQWEVRGKGFWHLAVFRAPPSPAGSVSLTFSALELAALLISIFSEIRTDPNLRCE